MPVFPSQEWLTEYVDLINGSKEYEEAASSWEGDLSYVFEREPDKKVPDDVWVWIDLWHGKCRDAKFGVAQEDCRQCLNGARLHSESRWRRGSLRA